MSQPQASDSPSPSNRWRVGILVFEGVEVLDFAGPYEVFSRTRLVPGPESRRDDASAPFEVLTVAPTPGVLRATGGLQIVPDHAFADAPPLDLLVVPGGFGTRALLHDETALAWIRRAADAAREVTSVCTGSAVLAKAGLLRGRRATTHHMAMDLLAAADPTVQVVRGERVVHDGVTSSAGVSAGIDMALVVVERLCGRDVADETASYIEFSRAAMAPAQGTARA